MTRVASKNTGSAIRLELSFSKQKIDERTNPMKQLILISLVLMLGIISGAFVSPLLAQSQASGSQQATCYVGEGSSAACSGKWIYFAGNTGALDESAWVVRVDSETGKVWFKNGKKLQLLIEDK